MTGAQRASAVDVESLARDQAKDVRQAVRVASERKVVQRRESLEAAIHDPEALRHVAARVRQHALDNLAFYLEKAEERLTENGVQVHWARTGSEACEIIAGICKSATKPGEEEPGIVKSKSMVSEEIRLNDFLEARGFHPVETDLGEFVVQLDHDHPTHIVTPIIHKTRKDVARAFVREGIGEYTEDPKTLTRQAREYLREKFRRATIGITGANFVVAESGRMVIVTNEGNGRMCTTAPRVHIALTGIEKIVAREADLSVLLKLLARSSTGQDLTVYTNIITGPRRPEEPDGPDEVHLVFLDNGRSDILGTQFHEMLRCIRCGACLNVCPVYRQVTGRGYDSVYPGPMGAVLSPLLKRRAAENPYVGLPKASSLCGACQEVCPVDIPIPEFLLGLRAEFQGKPSPVKGAPPFAPWAFLTSHPSWWRAALSAGRRFGWRAATKAPVDAFKRWLQVRELPEWPKESFRDWWKKRNTDGGGEAK